MAMCGFGVTCASAAVGFANVITRFFVRIDVKCGLFFARKRFIKKVY